MAVKALTTSFFLTRTTNLIQGSVANQSWCIWFRPDSDANVDYQTVIALESAAAFQGVYSDSVGPNFSGQTCNGGPVHNTATKTFVAGQWYPIWYRKVGNNHSFYVSGTFLGGTTDDMSAVTWLNLFLGTDGAGKNRGTFKDYREWNVALTVADLFLESNSPDPVHTANLVTNTSLVSNFLDSTSNHNNWIPSGVVNVDYQFVTDDPIPAIGTVSTNPIVIVNLPYSTTINAKPGNVEFYFNFWISYTPKAGEVVIGPFAFTSLIAPNKPTCTFYVGPRTAPVRLNTTIDINDASIENIPYSVPVSPGVESLTLITTSGALAGTIPISFSVLPGPKTASVPGNLLVWDETFGFPLVVLRKEDGTILNHYNFSASEAGDIQVDGSILADAIDFSASPIGLQLWNPDLTLNQTIPYPVSFHGGVFSIRKSYLGGWFVSTKGDGVNGNVRKVNSDGSFVATVWTPPYNNANVVGIAPSPDDTILYYAITGIANNPVKRWNLSTNVAMTDLAAGIANYQVQQDILVLGDGTILVQYAKISAPRDNFVKHYAADGTVLNTYNFGTGILLNRGARGLDNLTSFWVWIYNEPQISNVLDIYNEIKVSDGSILNTWQKNQYVRGTWVSDPTAAPSDRFGPSFSCPFMVSPVSLTPATLLGGIYKIVPGKRNDTLWQTFSPETTLDVKIPDPLARTALLGG